MYTYLLLNILSISFPLVRSFEHRINLVSKWKALLPAITITAVVFLVWDVWFTAMGVWGFTPRFLVGLDLAGLPLEEWLFFFTIPYACLFIYEVMNYFVKKDVLGTAGPWIALALGLGLSVLAILNTERWYTFLTFALAGVWMLGLFLARPKWLGRFFLAYAVSLVPFLIVNGVLTGFFFDEPVVWYNNAQNLAIRIGSIPIEDTMYLLLLLGMITTFYEALKKRFGIA